MLITTAYKMQIRQKTVASSCLMLAAPLDESMTYCGSLFHVLIILFGKMSSELLFCVFAYKDSVNVLLILSVYISNISYF